MLNNMYIIIALVVLTSCNQTETEEMGLSCVKQLKPVKDEVLMDQTWSELIKIFNKPLQGKYIKGQNRLTFHKGPEVDLNWEKLAFWQKAISTRVTYNYAEGVDSESIIDEGGIITSDMIKSITVGPPQARLLFILERNDLGKLT